MTTTTESARVIEARALSKRYGDKVAVDTLSFTVAPGKVTGFLGPNGAGKSTTMRLLLGLDRPDRGTATIGGGPYRDLPRPLCTGATSTDVAQRIWPSPVTIHFVVVSSASPIGPRACIFCVEMPISAPKPNCSPSVNRVDALTITAAESHPEMKD
jgi:ABC-type uncharacterized transport system ATPase subunit